MKRVLTLEFCEPKNVIEMSKKGRNEPNAKEVFEIKIEDEGLDYALMNYADDYAEEDATFAVHLDAFRHARKMLTDHLQSVLNIEIAL